MRVVPAPADAAGMTPRRLRSVSSEIEVSWFLPKLERRPSDSIAVVAALLPLLLLSVVVTQPSLLLMLPSLPSSMAAAAAGVAAAATLLLPEACDEAVVCTAPGPDTCLSGEKDGNCVCWEEVAPPSGHTTFAVAGAELK